MNVLLLRNAQRWRTLFWPVMPGCLAPIAAGAAFEVHGAELERDTEVRDVLRVLLRESLVAVEAIGEPPLSLILAVAPVVGQIGSAPCRHRMRSLDSSLPPAAG